LFLVACLAALVTGLIYLPARRNGFVNLDDYIYVVYNRGLALSGTEFLRFAFLSLHGELWIPLTWLSLGLDHLLWGSDPSGYHLTNLLLHAVNSFFAALVTARLAQCGAAAHPEEPREGRANPALAALLAGLWFGLAPLHVESVVWVTERKDVLNACCVLPALLLYLRYARERGAGQSPARRLWSDPRYLGSLGLFLLSLLAKSMTVTFPLLLLLLDWYPLRRLAPGRPRLPVLLEKLPFLLASLAVGAVTLVAQQGTLQSFAFASPYARLLVAARGIAFYLEKWLVPLNLMPFYVHPGNAVSLADPVYGFSLALVLALCAGAAWLAWRRSWRALPVALACFLVALFPVLGFSQSGPQAMADRFCYLPLLAPIATASIGLARWHAGSGRLPRVLLVGVSLAALTFYGGVTRQLIGVWYSTETLWSRVIEIAPDSSGRAYFERGQYYLDCGSPQRAMPDLSRSLEIAARKGYRNTQRIYGMRGAAFLKLGRYREAVEDYTRAIDGSPQPVGEYFSGRSQAFGALGRLEEARRDAQAAQQLPVVNQHSSPTGP
jgi:tetratricopeptide (TPR) repeat protein